MDHEQWFVISHDAERGIVTQGKFEGALLRVRYLQEIPDDFAGQNREIGAAQPNMIGNTQRHRKHVARVPDSVSNAWAEEDRHLEVEEKQEAVTRRLNSNEWRDLRTGGGKL